MITLLPVAVAIVASGLPPPATNKLQRGECLSLVRPKFEHDLEVAGALLKVETGQFSRQALRVPGSGANGPLGVAVTAAALVAGIAGLVGSGSAGSVSSGIMRETQFLSG